MDNETITTDPSMKAEIFSKFFGSVFTVDNGLCPDVNNRAVDDGLSTPQTVRSVLPRTHQEMR